MNFRRTRSKEIQNDEETHLNQSSDDDSDENDKNDEIDNNPIENVIETSESHTPLNTNADISDINKQQEKQKQKQKQTPKLKQNMTDNNQSPTTEERKQKEKEQEKESQTPRQHIEQHNRQHNQQKDETLNSEYRNHNEHANAGGETMKKDGSSEIEMSLQTINDNETKYKKSNTKNSNNSNSSIDSDGKFASSRKLGKYSSLAHIQRDRAQGVCGRLCISSIDPRLEELAQDIIKDKDGSLNNNNPNDDKNIEIAVQRTLAAHDNRRLSTILTQTQNKEQFKMYKQIHCFSWYSWLIEISLFVNIMKIFWEPASLSESVKIVECPMFVVFVFVFFL